MPLITSRIGLADSDSPRREDEDQGLTQFGAGFSAGLKQTQGLLGGGLPALINSALGNEDATLEYLDYYNKKMEEAAEIGSDFQRVEDIDGAEDAVQWLTYTLGKALPDIGTSIIGGGVSGAAVKYGAKKYIAETVERDVKKKAGDAFEKAMVKKELARRTAKARRVGAAIGGYGTSIALNAGETFANVYEESGGIQDPALALGTGIAAGALDALAPMSILKKILPDNMAEPFKEAMVDRLLRNKGMVQRAFIEGVRTGGIEGATEAAQEVLQATAVGMFNDPESGYKSYGESFFDALNNPTEQQKSQYLNAFAAGLVGGGGMGGISGAMYKPRSAPEAQEEEAQQSPMPDSEGNMPVETPQSEELEAQQAGFDSYVDYLDAYESGPARRNRGVSLEAIQNIIPDEYYLGQDISEDENARLEAETLQLRDEFNPSLNDLVGQVVGQDDSEGVLRRREDGIFAYTDFQTGEEIIIESGEANQDQPAEVSGLEQRDSTVELEGGRGVTFNAEDSTFTARRGTFRYFSTNYDENGEVATVTAETMDGEPRTFGKKMAKAIEDAKAGVEMQQMRSDLANQIVQADDLPEDLQVALVQADVLEETIPVEQVEEIIQTMPEARQEPLRKRIESLMTRDEMMETPIAASTFDRTDETNIFNGVINRAGSVTLEERQTNLDATAGQEIQQPNGDDPIVIPSTGLDGIAEKVATAMRNQFKVRNQDKTVSFYQPANKYLGEANQDIAEEIQQAVFDLVESGMAPEAISSLEQISVHTDDDFNGADGVALASGVSLRDGVVDKARTDEGASALRMILAHEMHHVFDLNNDITLNLPSFKTEISFTAEGPVMTAGDVVMELYENYVNETEVGRLFAYPFNMLDEDTQDLNADFDVLGRTMEQEVFAQLGAVYVSDPRLLKSQAPEAYEVIRTIRGADNATDQNTETQVQPEGTGVQGEVRPSTVSGSAEVEDAGGTGVVSGDGAEAGPTSEVVGGETEQPDGDSDGRVVRPEDLVIKRADNFSTNGEYNVTFPDGTVTQIFRDTLQFSAPRWIWVESDANSPEAIFGIGDNRNEAVQRLIQLMGYDLPAPDNVLLSRGSGSKVDKSRRELLRKIATVAVVSGSGFKGTSYVAEIASNPELVRGKAKPISDFVQRPLPEESVSALASGDLPRAIDIAVAGAPQDVIDLAERIKATLPEQDLYDTDVQRGQWNVAGMVRLKDTPTITIMPDTKDSGMTGTLLHEAMHLGIAARYRSLSTVASSNYELLGMDQPKAREALDQWNNLWKEFRRAVNPNLQLSKVKDLPFETQVAYGNPDEFFVRALTQPEFQQQLHEIDYEGKTLLERFKDWVKRYLFGPDTGVQPTYLDAAMTAANDLFDAATLDSPDFAFMRGINAELAQQRDGTQNEIVDTPLFMRSPMGLVSARETAAATSYPNQRPFKVDLQQKSLDEQERMGLNLREDTEEANKYLVEITVSDAQEALVDNENAIGWYDRTVGEAINTLAKIHPEIATDPQAKFAFTFALANTSNGLKVDKNFELAESAYRAYKEAGDGKFPTNVGIGNAAAAINKTFKLFNDMVEQYGINDVMELFNSKTTVGELQKAGFKVTGEWVDTEVYGAAIIGPKIGNGFFANLNGNFDQLTMDRWLRRTWGRWTGTLIGERPDLIADKTKKMRQIVAKMTAEEKRSFKELGVNIRTQSNADVIDTANAIQKASMVPANREVMNRTDLGQDLRKVGNGLAKDADGQIEAPTAAERNRIRRVFNDALTELRNDYPELTMADLQALLWYPEKRLYDGARSQEEFENGYEDAEAPDYANAAARLAERFGVDSDRRGAGDARSGDVAEQPAVAEQAEGTATPQDGAPEQGLATTVKVGKPNTKVRPSVQRAYAALQAGQITRQEYDEAVLETIRPYEAVPTPATEEEMLNALAGRQKERINQPIEEGSPVGLRLDINAYENKGTWVPTIHRNGSSPVHQATASITDADFTLFKQDKSQKVMEGVNKSPFAQIKGAYVNRTDEENVRLAQQYLNDPEWRQIGFDPRRHATFYDRTTGEPIATADEVIQVGPLVLAKNAETLEVDQVLYKRGQKNSHAEASVTGELTNGQPSTNEFTLDDETRTELFLRKIQDKYFSLKKFEDAAAEFLGLKELPEHMQTYVPETLHSGKIKTDFDDLENTYVAPLAKILRDNDIDPDDFGLYLMAKHAPERNRRVALLYQDRDMVGPLPDFVGAGISTEDANRVVAELENPSMIKAAGIVYDMLAKNRERMVEAGLINEDTADSWDSNYQFYVPLKGFATTEDESGNLIAPRGLPKGFSVSGKESFKALGRTSQAENPALFAIADSEEKIVRARRNEVGQQFLTLADAIEERGSEQLKVYRTEDVYPTVRAKNSKGKYINKQMRADEMRMARRLDNGDPRFMSVKVEGEEIFIEIKNEGLNRAMHNVGGENYDGLQNFLGSLAQPMQKFQNFRRNMLINWNPSWFLINPLRDIQTGLMYNLAQESKEGGMIEGENLTGEIIRRYLPAYSAYYKNLRGNKADNEYDAYYAEYQKAGAPTGLTLTKDIDEQRARLFALVTDGPLVAKGKQGLQEIEYLNQASENAVRFSAYVSAREAGVSVQKAANLAKNLTVNFNRKGEISSGLNLLYLFFNAAVQGTANIAQAMSGRTADGSLTKAQIGAAGIALVAYMVTQHNLGAADEDDDGESIYNDLSDYDHLMSWNMVMDDGKTFFQIPMPYGYGFFHTLGRLGAEYMNETKDEGDVAAELTASFAHHMLPPPLGFVGSVGTVDDLDEFGKRMVGNVAPTIFEPVMQYATNTNHFGSPLYLEDNPLIRPASPDSSRAKRSTSQVYRDIAEWMNDATGGSLYRSGAVDVSPDGMQYLQEYLLGGLGRFVNRSADLAAKYNSPEDEGITASDVPIVRYFFGEPSDYADKMDYYDYIGSATQIFKENEEATGAEKLEFQREFGSVTKLEPLYKETQKQLRKLRQRKKQIEKTQKDPVKAYDQIQKLEAEMQKLYDRFNQRYREATR